MSRGVGRRRCRAGVGGAADAAARREVPLAAEALGRRSRVACPEPAEGAEALVKRLVALVPPRGLHLTCFHGVFAPNANLRAAVMLPPELPPPALPTPPESGKKPTRSRMDWATALERTFGIDVWRCHCGGKRSVRAIVTNRATALAMLRSMGLESEAPTTPHPAAQSPPQLSSVDVRPQPSSAPQEGGLPLSAARKTLGSPPPCRCPACCDRAAFAPPCPKMALVAPCRLRIPPGCSSSIPSIRGAGAREAPASPGASPTPPPKRRHRYDGLRA